jgi:hypothetical protein
VDPVDRDLNAYLAEQWRAELDAEELDDYMTTAIEEDLDDGAECLFVLAEIEADSQPMERLLANLSATNLDDWQRLMLRCPVGDADIVAVNFRDWAVAQLLLNPPQWIENRARQMMIDDKDDTP